jgi:hypothetical protein
LTKRENNTELVKWKEKWSKEKKIKKRKESGERIIKKYEIFYTRKWCC